jgi:hypothetical protein
MALLLSFPYLSGGSIADKYAPKYLIAIAYFLPPAGGILLANVPDFGP